MDDIREWLIAVGFAPPSLIPSLGSDDVQRGISVWYGRNRKDNKKKTQTKMMKFFISPEENVYSMSINGITKAMFHRVDSKSVEDKYWYTSSMEESTDHLLRLYGTFMAERFVFLIRSI